MDIPFAVASQQALLRQNVAMETIKQSAQQDRQIANILQESVNSSIPADGSRGTKVNLLV